MKIILDNLLLTCQSFLQKYIYRGPDNMNIYGTSIGNTPGGLQEVSFHRRAKRIAIVQQKQNKKRKCHNRGVQEEELKMNATIRRRKIRATLSDEQKGQQRQQNAQQRHSSRLQHTSLYNGAKQHIACDVVIEPHWCGSRNQACSYCHALKWPLEKGRESMCCSKGQNCNLKDIFAKPLPPLIRDLLCWDISTNVNSPTKLTPAMIKHFRTHIRQYNCALQMASSGIKIDTPPNGISMIVVKGAIHHLIGPLIPDQGSPKFAQLYIIDNQDEEVNQRITNLGGVNSDLDRELLKRLQDMLHTFNPFVKQFKQTISIIKGDNSADLTEYKICISTDGKIDHRRYNCPTGHGLNELAGFMPGSENDVIADRRDIQLRAKGDGRELTCISDCHKHYDSLHFVLLHPQGQQGWEKNGILRLPHPQCLLQRKLKQNSNMLLYKLF